LDWAAAIVMLCTTVGPAWVAEMIMRRREPAIRLVKEARRLRRRIRVAERRHQRAQWFVYRLSKRTSRWEDDAAQGRAIYVRAHRLAAAGRGSATPKLAPEE
jgi:hypothetical protein